VLVPNEICGVCSTTLLGGGDGAGHPLATFHLKVDGVGDRLGAEGSSNPLAAGMASLKGIATRNRRQWELRQSETGEAKESGSWGVAVVIDLDFTSNVTVYNDVSITGARCRWDRKSWCGTSEGHDTQHTPRQDPRNSATHVHLHVRCYRRHLTVMLFYG
jgi:hypothetical protein